MLDIQGRKVTKTSKDLSRRDFIRVGGTGMLGLGLMGRAVANAAGAANKSGHAKAVIQLWMNGGPSQIDTFDCKPELGIDYTGPLRNPIETNVSGIRISQLLPRLARQADKYTIIRSMTHVNNSHDRATYTMMTGMPAVPETSHPAMGAVVAHTQREAGSAGSLPPYITLPHRIGRFAEHGFLGDRYRTFSHPECDVPGDARTAFDLSREKESLQDTYGRHRFGQSCLLARRLVEHGVPFVTVNMGGWDTHVDNFETMQRLLPMLDRGFAALLEDLSQRGLLESTIVVWQGEFGRTPRLADDPPWYGGRHHFSDVFSAVVAGGGFKGGQVIGSSDARGESVLDRPVHPWDLSASIYRLTGIDPLSRLPHPTGEIAYATPFGAGKVPSGGLLAEIMPTAAAMPAMVA